VKIVAGRDALQLSDLPNLMVTHAKCNFDQGTVDFFDWMEFKDMVLSDVQQRMRTRHEAWKKKKGLGTPDY
jgi:hypothetical protein